MIITNRVGQSSFEGVLKQEVAQASEIWITTAYISPAGCELIELRQKAAVTPVHLSIGRAGEEGLPQFTLNYLLAFDSIARKIGGGVRVATPCSHSKIYYFQKQNSQHLAWVGSSNLSVHGLREWAEANIQANSTNISDVFQEVQLQWQSGDSLSTVSVARPPIRQQGTSGIIAARAEDLPEEPNAEAKIAQRICLSLYSKNRQVPNASGLNWAFGAGRPRNPNEAYVPLPRRYVAQISPVFGSNMPGTIFQAVMHDGTLMRMKLEGTGNSVNPAPKQIASTPSKSVFGEWILRSMLKISPGTPVTFADLTNYGRTDICFTRIGTDNTTGEAVVFCDFRP